MGKELIISSNRHETKVAVLEDDQLVEIYFQRSKEYSLAGSIHKGRVTRVLPGMQSAFVDIGLERDAFLYVSDFFDENEEYDKIAPAEDRTARNGKSVAAVAPEPEQITPIPETVDSEVEKASDIVDAASPKLEDEGLEGKDRKGRRSRRRRSRGRGFPESKYASDVVPERTSESQPELQEAHETQTSTAEEFPVLPGETLAKYRRPAHSDVERLTPAESEPDSSDQATESALPAGTGAPTETDPDPVALNGQDVSTEHISSYGELYSEEVSGPVSQTADADLGTADQLADQGSADAETQDADTAMATGSETEEAERPGLSEQDELSTETAGPEPFEVEPVAEEDLASKDESEADAEEFESDLTLAGTEEGEGQEVADVTAQSGAENEVEPARIPVSLTATLRERGDRYMHRVSRRARRKMRFNEAKPEERKDESPRAAVEEDTPAQVVRTGRADRPDRPPLPSISELLREGQEILVQIAKEPLGQKGARITSHIALPGRYVVYMPTVEHMGVSRKISSDEERLRLKRILQHHRVATGGFIVRTAGEGKTEQEIGEDMRFLYNLWLDLKHKAEVRPAPALIHHDLDLVRRILRDQMTDTFKTVWVDNEDVYESVLRFVERFQPSAVARVKLYTRTTPIFDAFNVTNELEKALRPKVWLKSGGYIVINQTEALVAIDVNTGKFVGKSNRLEDTIVKTNTEAVREIVRQVRLRDLGGIIVVDFIDMDERKNRQKVMQALEEAMRADRAPNKILQFNDFGLVAITRKRVKQSLERTLCSPCPYCEGAGYVKSVQTVMGEILQEAHKMAPVIEGKDATLRVNPEVAKALKSHDNHYLEELEEILRRPVLVKSDPLLQQEKFDLV